MSIFLYERNIFFLCFCKESAAGFKGLQGYAIAETGNVSHSELISCTRISYRNNIVSHNVGCIGSCERRVYAFVT